ncbi:MAG: adenylate kinase [Candidatus Omnitrophica bacterium]|nr:adenylate kinase [Candidatus Omnitrophota bacterium]
MNIILFGAPGSGKGTQAIVMSEQLGLRRISLGDILRKEVKEDTDIGQEVKSYMNQGQLVPDELVARVIENHIDSKGFILDGYPRNVAQAKKLEDILKNQGLAIDLFVYMDVSRETVVDRLTKRIVCKSCGANYHLKNMPPKKEGICDSCSNELVQRKDDTPEVILKRWEVFLKESSKLVNFYKSRGNLFKVDANFDKDLVFEKIKAEVK